MGAVGAAEAVHSGQPEDHHIGIAAPHIAEVDNSKDRAWVAVVLGIRTQDTDAVQYYHISSHSKEDYILAAEHAVEHLVESFVAAWPVPPRTRLGALVDNVDGSVAAFYILSGAVRIHGDNFGQLE